MCIRDSLNAKVILEKYYDEALSDHGTELSKDTNWPLTNKFVIEQMEDKILLKEIPLANDETIHLAEKRLGL